MNEKVIKVFFDQNGLPYKDRELTTHYPLVGSGFLGASNTTKIRFYFENIGTLSDTYLAVSKLPNGKQGSQLLNIKSSDENGQYAELSLSEWYFQAKGDVFIGLKVYRGGVEVEIDDETGFSIVSGDPVIMVTGSIKLAINYAPIGDVPDYRDEFTAYNDILALMGEKPDIEAVPLLVNFSDYATWGDLYEYVGTRPFIAYVNGVLSVCAIESEDSAYKLLVNNSTGIFRTSTFALDSAISISSSSLTEIELKTDNCVELVGTSGTLTSRMQTLLAKDNAYIKIGTTYYHKLFNGAFINLETVALSDGRIAIGNKLVLIQGTHYDVYNYTNYVYDTNQIDTKIAQAISSVYKYKGSVATYNDLPSSDLTIGDVYNVEDTGDNYAWTGTTWDKLAGTVDLSDYATKSELTSGLATKQNTLVNKSNIKALVVNGEEKSLLGDGTIVIPNGGGGTWGSITGDIDDQTDLQNELQDIREVAEGKCKTYVLSYQTTLSSIKSEITNDNVKVYNESGIDISQDILDGDYDNELIINSSFNSQDSSIGIDAGENNYLFIRDNQENFGYDYKMVLLDAGGGMDTFFKTGDILLVIETDVPDRWFDAYSPFTCFHKLETSKIDLDNYATKTEVNAKSDLTNIAPAYDEHTTYSVGEVVSYNGKIYKCTTAITTPESWDSTHWTETNVASDFVNLTGTQVISGNKEFSNKIVAPQIEQPAGTLYIGKTGNAITINGSFAPDVDDYREIGDSSHRYKNIHLSGIFNPNASGYGLSLPSTASLTANSELIDSASDQTISGIKAFENGIKLNPSAADPEIKWNSSLSRLAVGTFSIAVGGTDSYISSKMIPYPNNTYDLGTSVYKWKNLYLGGSVDFGDGAKIYKDSSNRVCIQYNNSDKIKVASSNTIIVNRLDPDSDNSQDIGRNTVRWKDIYLSGVLSDGTNSVSVAGISNGIFNVINASDIVSNTLTQAQFDLITNGKPTLIKGTYQGYKNMLITYWFEYSNSWRALAIAERTVFSMKLRTGTNLLELGGDDIALSKIANINGIGIVQYYKKPQSSVSLSDGGTITDSALKSLIQNEQPIKLNGFTCYFSCDDGTNYQYVSTRYDSVANKNHINVITIDKSTWVATFHTSDIAV